MIYGPSMVQHTNLRLRVNGVVMDVRGDVPASMTLLHWLRGPAGLTGTKEGCAEGDCGACTVVLEQPDGGRTPINACLVMLGQLHGASIRTVEGLRGSDGGAHPVQLALASGNATQCGFCTPGFVMAAWAYAQEGGDRHEALAGNLCRCTGYRPIIDALEGVSEAPEVSAEMTPAAPAVFSAGGCVFHVPTELDALLALRAAHPAAWLLAGGTDLGLAVAEGRGGPAEVISLLGVKALQRLEVHPEGLLVGAAAPYARLLAAVRGVPALQAMVPMLVRLGSRQIRGLGTLGGNLGTASPIGDMLPPLLALGATVRLRSQRGARELAVADFLLGYRRNALAEDEIIEAVWLPCVPEGAVFACEKLSKRYDQDISTASAAFLIERRSGIVARARLAFGGMGAKAARATRAEAALVGSAWSPAALEAAAAALAEDFAPLSDLRSTAGYRRAAAAGLLRRLWWRADGVTADVQAFA